jgi:hypothetical protein
VYFPEIMLQIEHFEVHVHVTPSKLTAVCLSGSKMACLSILIKRPLDVNTQMDQYMIYWPQMDQYMIY